MADRDESRDVAILALGERLTRMVPWPLRSILDGYYDGTVLVLRMVPHSDLETVESERDALRNEVSRLVEALGIARQHVEKLAATRAALCRLRDTLDRTIADLWGGE